MAKVPATARRAKIGKRPVPIPQGVTVTLSGRTLTAKGPKGELTRTFHDAVDIVERGGNLEVVPSATAGRRGAQFQGLSRALVANMLEGVSAGYDVALDLHGVGYRAAVAGDALTLNLGYSHPIEHRLHEQVRARVEIIDEGGTKRPRLHLSSCNKEALGQTAAQIRSYRKPEPYKGKGVRYVGEQIREKAGKAGAKAG